MRKFLQTSAAVLALTLAATAGRAQNNQTSGQSPDQPHGQFQGHRGEWGHHGPNPEFETKMLTRRLGLSAEQQTSVEQILTQRDTQLKALKPAEGATPDFKAMHEQRKAIMESTQAQLDTVLTTEQKTQLAEMHKHQFHGGPHGNWKPQSGATAPTAPSL
jgi:predicted outer membrane protein